MTKQELGLDSKPLRPLDKAAMSNDSATLRALTGMLNNPEITGAVVPKEERYDGPGGKNGETIPPIPLPPSSDPATVSPPVAPVAALPFPSAQNPGPRPDASTVLHAQTSPTPAKALAVGAKLLLTGRGVSDIAKAIGASEYNIMAPVLELAKKFFPAIYSLGSSSTAPGSENFLATLKAWGSGEVTTNYPLTPARAVFVQMIRSFASMKNVLPAGVAWEKFGDDEGFWIDSCVRAALADFDAPRVVVTGVTSKHEFEYVRTQGFQHWHSTARPGVGGHVDALSGSLDNDVTKVVSMQRNGPKLRCVWKDTTPPLSNRLWSMAEFANAAATPAEVPTTSFE